MMYAPVTHWVWGGGWLGEMEPLDFAGGVVVHVTASRSASGALYAGVLDGDSHPSPREASCAHG